jgi:hypothetical protein
MEARDQTMTTIAEHLRKDLTPLPARLRQLPIDHRGYPVPWFVQWVDARGRETDAMTRGAIPEFRLMDGRKWARAVREGRCWVCGDLLGVYKTFVVGPMCGINRTTTEPPSHLECAEWSAVNCPFLVRPRMVRRDNDGLHATAEVIGGVGLDRNPGVALLWTTKQFAVWRDDAGKPLIRIGDPTAVRWYAEGRPATRAEVVASVAGGLPFLRALAEEQDRAEPGAIAELETRAAAFEALYPAA